MSWSEIWHAWRRWAVAPAAAPGQDGIDEELMFHFRSLVDENVSQGMPLDAAWRAAEDRFGSLSHYSDECHRVVLGVQPMLQRLSVAGLVVLTLFVAWLFLEVRSLRVHAAPPNDSSSNDQLAQNTPADKKPAPKNDAADLAGTITDRQGKSVADVDVLVILKTWPNNRYRQEDFATKTDGKGKFRIAGLVPKSGQRAIHLAAVKDGYALTSLYELRKPGEKLASESLKIKLDDAVPLTLTVRDAQGNPAAKARVIPFSRAAGGEEHGVYFQAAKPIENVADEKGQVRLSVFRRGDSAQIYIALPDKEWEQCAVAIPESGDAIEASSQAQ